jgi:hypothetical protein
MGARSCYLKNSRLVLLVSTTLGDGSVDTGSEPKT